MINQKTFCHKCNHESETNKFRFNIPICELCLKFAPTGENEFLDYVKEKIDGKTIETFRKNLKHFGESQKTGMQKKAVKGMIQSRPPFGYQILNGKLHPAENFREVEEIFEEFLNTTQSLTQLSKKRNFSVNGLKKILKNYTYIGKIKFNNQIHEGNHQPILSSTLFNHVQNKLEKLGIKTN